MGILNWPMKGFNAEKRAQPPRSASPEAESLVQELKQEANTTPEEKASAVLFNFQAPQQQQYQHHQQGFSGAFQGATLGNRHILVVTPRSDQEVIGVVEHLKTNEAVIVNFEGVPASETQRRIDFLSGVACGLGGAIRPLDSFKYIITPSGIGVR